MSVAAVVALAAAVIGVWKFGSRGGAVNHPAVDAQQGAACAPGSIKEKGPQTPGTSERLTNVLKSAAELLRVRGAAWGPEVATGTELSVSEAFEQVAALAGDATIVEVEWLRQAGRDGVHDDPNRSLEAIVRHIESTTITDADLVEHLGPNWLEIVETVASVAFTGFDEYVTLVRSAPAMRATNALDIRSQLRRKAAELGLQAQWDRSQDLVAVYFQRCTTTSLSRRGADVPLVKYIEEWDLAEALVRDSIAAAFFANASGNDREQIKVLGRGLRIVQRSEEFNPGSLTRSVQPTENLDPADAELLEAEEPVLDDN